MLQVIFEVLQETFPHLETVRKADSASGQFASVTQTVIQFFYDVESDGRISGKTFEARSHSTRSPLFGAYSAL